MGFFVVVGCDAFKRATKFEIKSLTIFFEISVFFAKIMKETKNV